jgi:hypothetical protein
MLSWIWVQSEYNLSAVNSIIKCFSRDLVTEYCQGLESSAVHSAPPFLVETLHGRWNRSLPRLPLHMHAQSTGPTFLTSNICIGLCIPKALTLTPLQSYEMFKVLQIVTIYKTVGLRGILNFHLVGGTFPYRLARRIHLNTGVPYPLQSKVRTQPPHLGWTILALQISINAWHQPHPLHSDGQ